MEGVKIPKVAFVDESLPDSSTYILAATICNENEVERVRSFMAALLLAGQVRQDAVEARAIAREKHLVVPPLGTRQRHLEKTLGKYRLNLGDGYAIHGTQATGQLGRSVSHGCVRVGDQDLEKLYRLAQVGDEVIIY